MGRCMMRARHEDAGTSEGSAGFSDGCQACQRRARRAMVVVRRIESGMSGMCGMSGMGKRLLSHPCHRWRWGRSRRRRAETAARQRAACSKATRRPTTRHAQCYWKTTRAVLGQGRRVGLAHVRLEGAVQVCCLLASLHDNRCKKQDGHSWPSR
jgi:hypothetical protein